MALKLAFASLVLSGCFWVTTKSEGQKLRKAVDNVQARIDSKEKQLDTQIKQLQTVLDESSKVLKRNSADLGADVDKLSQDVRTANGLATAVNNSFNELKLAFDKYRRDSDARIDALEQRLAQIESGKPTASSSPDDLWRLGTAAFEARRYAEANDIYQRLVATAPGHQRADDAQYFRGQCFYNLKEWDKSIGAFQQLYEKFASSDLADDGLYFAALAAQQLKNCAEARTYLGLVTSKYPKSNVLKQVKDLETVIKKDLKNKSKCSS